MFAFHPATFLAAFSASRNRLKFNDNIKVLALTNASMYPERLDVQTAVKGKFTYSCSRAKIYALIANLLWQIS